MSAIVPTIGDGGSILFFVTEERAILSCFGRRIFWRHAEHTAAYKAQE
jgi:hypothetical protein